MVIIGHSHVVCVAEAAAESGVACHQVQLKTLKRVELIAERELHPDFLAHVEALLQRDGSPMLVSCIGGALHTGLGLLQHPEPFDFVIPSRPDLPLASDAAILPFAAIKTTMQRRLNFDFFVLRKLSQALAVPVVHFCCPPPAKDEDFVYETMPPRLREDVMQAGVSPAPLRLKLWKLEADLFEETCAAVGIRFVPPPREALDGDYLAGPYRKNASHGNAAYGRLVLDQMEGLPA